MASRMIWVEVKGTFELLRRPEWKETVSLRTNTGTASALQARRFVEMTDEKGEVIGRADLLWVLIDFDRRRPIPLKRANLDPSVTNNCPPITSEIEEPEWPAEMPAGITLTAPRRDVDFNGHINNSAYLIWALDALPADERPGKAPKNFHLNFKHETFAGEEVEIRHAVVGHTSRHLISTGETLRAEIIIEWEA